jgi:hypothetical protein
MYGLGNRIVLLSTPRRLAYLCGFVVFGFHHAPKSIWDTAISRQVDFASERVFGLNCGGWISAQCTRDSEYWE